MLKSFIRECLLLLLLLLSSLLLYLCSFVCNFAELLALYYILGNLKEFNFEMDLLFVSVRFIQNLSPLSLLHHLPRRLAGNCFILILPVKSGSGKFHVHFFIIWRQFPCICFTPSRYFVLKLVHMRM